MDSSFSGCVALETLEGIFHLPVRAWEMLFQAVNFDRGSYGSLHEQNISFQRFQRGSNDGNGLNVNLSYDSGKCQETANTGLYGTSKSASRFYKSLKSSLEGSLSSGSHITVTINESEEETKE